ncbi:Conserved hypothetical protein (DUF195) [Candidatus Phytoplasma australiense]|uniref:DNA recombination protein RmuC n=2 Tax=Phytoplasma australiense TaxID=59748 RepID=B1VAK3_PHYAS|nr:DNA recombination protein RmuC [Candidatus Phytoplasma australiense]AGL90374.1 RmuC Family Protein [Strawberry lethal yellows phytoplasma (CPA) str. NZSb11]CAM11976.1 Conserved hypothetical protein (DUF195) [Candidatus Phytoplasma australiense]
MDTLQILILILLAILIIITIFIIFILSKFFLKNQPLENNFQDLKQSFNMLDIRINNLTHQSKDSLTQEIKDTRKHLISNLENSLKVLREQNASGFQGVQDIHKLLSQNDKAGQAGEFLLNRILENISYIKDKLVFQKQFVMKKTINRHHLRVDVMCKGHGKFIQIPIDSKFPTRDFLTFLNDDNQIELKKRFSDNVKKRIKEVQNYVSQEDSAPYAIMFVPSESIFSQINADQELISFAFSRNVIVASPSILLAILNSVDYYLQVFESVQNNEEKLDCINKVFEAMRNFDKTLFNNLKTSLQKTLDVIEDMDKKEKTLQKRYEKLLEVSKREKESKKKL